LICQQARSLVKAFGSDLKSVLITTMKTASPIAEKNSALSAWDIARTSLKVRNTSNVPDTWETTILRLFEVRKAAIEDINTMEHSEVVQVSEKTVLRYMKAIPTGGLCLVCYGSKLADDVSSKVNELYPNDQATGFKLGDIRGAFTLQKIKL
jgi:hypothetical protein